MSENDHEKEDGGSRTGKLSDTGGKLAAGVGLLVQQTVMNKSDSLPAGQYLALAASVGCVHVLAALCGNTNVLGNPLDAAKKVMDDEAFFGNAVATACNPASVAFAALLTVNAAPAANKTGDVLLEFSPEVLLKTLQDTEKFMGRNVDALLHPRMVEHIRKTEREGSKTLEDFLTKHGDSE